MSKKLKSLVIVYCLVLTSFFSLISVDIVVKDVEAAWWNDSWENCRAITIDGSTYVDNALTGFPLLVVLDNTSGDYCFRSDGNDIRFVNSANDTDFSYEIETFDNSGKTICWVNISEQISTSGDYNFLVYYNNSGASDGQDVAGTWDNDFIAVYHMNSMTDSTSYGNDATNSGSVDDSSGKIGSCRLFDGSNDYMLVNVIDNDFTATDLPFTTETWGCVDSTNDDNDAHQGIICLQETRRRHVTFRKDAGASWGVMTYVSHVRINGVNGYIDTGTNSVTYGNWQYVVAVNDDGDQRVYLNDTEKETGALTGNYETQTYDNLIGAYGTVGSTSGEWEGSIDEVRVSKVFRNASWIKASFHSQNQTTGFLTIGSEQDKPAGATVPVVTTNDAVGVEETNATLLGTLTDNGSADTTCYFILDTTHKFATIIFNVSKGVADGAVFSNDTSPMTTLTPGTLYYFDTQANNSVGWDGTGVYKSFLTKPNEPTGASCVAGESYINVSWTAATGADKYLVRNKIGSAPTTIADGTEFGNVTVLYVNSSLGSGTHYFSIWSFAFEADPACAQYSDAYDTTSGTEEDAPTWLSSNFGGSAEISSATWENTAPTIECNSTGDFPANESTKISLQPTVAVEVNDSDSNESTVWFYNSTDGSTWTLQQTNTSILNETVTYAYTEASSGNTVYYWKVSANDTHDNVSVSFNFTTNFSYTEQAPYPESEWDGAYENYTLVSLFGKIRASVGDTDSWEWPRVMMSLITPTIANTFRGHRASYVSDTIADITAVPAKIYVEIASATNVSFFRFYYYNESTINYCPTIYSVYNESTFVEEFNITATVNGQWVQCNLSSEIVECTNFTLQINETRGSIDEGGATRVAIACLQVFNRTDPNTGEPNQEDISYFEEIPAWWNGLDWASVIRMDDINDEANCKANGVYLIQPLTVGAWLNSMDSDEYNDTFIDDYHMEFGSHGDSGDAGAQWDQDYDWWFGRGEAIIAEEADITRTSQWGALADSSNKSKLLNYCIQSSAMSPDGAKALYDAGIRFASSWTTYGYCWSPRDPQNMSSSNITKEPTYPIEWLEQARCPVAYNWVADNGDEWFNASKNNGSLAISYIHPGDGAVDPQYQYVIENDITGWHATAGETVSYRWLRDYTNVTYNSTASSDSQKVFDIGVQGSEDRLWEVPLTFKFDITGFDWNETASVYWQNETLYSHGLNNISTFSTGSGHHINQTMREGYRYDADTKELWISTCPGNQTSPKSIYLYADVGPEIDISIENESWDGGSPSAGQSFMTNCTFWQNGSLNLDVVVVINSTNSNYTLVNYTDYDAEDEYCGNFTINAWGDETSINVSIWPPNTYILQDFATGSHLLGFRIWVPISFSSDEREDFEVILVATEHT